MVMADTQVLPPGPKGLPFLGNVLQFRNDQLNFLLEIQRTYGRMATIYIGKTPIVLLFRPEHVRYVLTENPRNFTNREVAGGLIFGNLLVLSLLAHNFTHKAIQGLEDIVGEGLLTTDGEYHHHHRHLLQPAFSKRRVENQAGLIVQYTREMLDRWQPGTEMDVTPDLRALILRITMKLLVNIDVAKDSAELAHIIDGMFASPVGLLEGLLNLQINLPFLPYGKLMSYKRQADTYVYNCIDQRLADQCDTGDILSILLQAMGQHDASMTKQHVRDELMTLTAAGHETSTNTLTWTLYLLAEHPTILERVLTELQMVLAGRDPQVDDLPRLTYLDCVIKESMRLYPSAWTQGRQAVEAFDLDGYHFPADTLLMFSQWVIHRLPDVWGDPDMCRPERWEPENRNTIPQWAYFPFGAGSRVCLGKPLAEMEIRLVLATILQRSIPSLVPGHPVVPLPLITLRLKHGLRLQMKPADLCIRY
jgi:cytochrome P450